MAYFCSAEFSSLPMNDTVCRVSLYLGIPVSSLVL